MIEKYDDRRQHWSYLRDAYMGGIFWSSPSATTLSQGRLRWDTGAIDATGTPVHGSTQRVSYLVPHEGESDRRFDARARLATYVNIVSGVVKSYSDGVTNDVARDLGALTDFAEDIDRRGNSWGEIVDSVAQFSCIYGIFATVVDAPRVDVAGLSEAERASRGLAPYVLAIHPPAWAWVEVEDERLVEFAYVRDAYVSNAQTTITLQIWRADRPGVVGGWETRQGALGTSVQISPESARALPLVASGPLPPALIGEIPVTFCYYDRDSSTPAPRGNSLISDTADAARLIYNTLSWATEINRLAAFPFLSVPLRSTGGQLDASTAAKIGPGQGLGYDSGSGSPSWVEPSGVSQTQLREHCVFVYQWAMRTAGLELAADSSAQVQSGEALRIRSRDFESRAKKFARNVWRWEMATLRLYAAMAGVSSDEITVTYPKRITLPDQSEDLTRALALLAAPIEIGASAKIAAVRQAVDSALALSDEQLAAIVDEIERLYMGDLEAHGAVQAVATMRARSEARGLTEVLSE